MCKLYDLIGANKFISMFSDNIVFYDECNYKGKPYLFFQKGRDRTERLGAWTFSLHLYKGTFYIPYGIVEDLVKLERLGFYVTKIEKRDLNRIVDNEDKVFPYFKIWFTYIVQKGRWYNFDVNKTWLKEIMKNG
jgi:hypothetical protein